MLDLISIFGIILTITVFGTLIGLTIVYSNFSKKAFTAIVIGNCVGIIFLTYFTAIYGNSAYKFINDYNPVISLLISSIMLLLGIFLISKWKKNPFKISKFVTVTLSCSSIIAIITTIMLITASINFSIVKIGFIAAFLLMIVIAISYLISGSKKLVKRPYPIFLGKFMLLLGFYFLASAIVVPNIISVLQSPIKPININSLTNLIYIVVFVILLLFYGFYRKRRQNSTVR
jgi:predicted transporter